MPHADDPIRLTQIAKRAGCAAKQPPGYLLPLLDSLPPIDDPAVLVGNANADDAAVIRLDDERALVMTTDFFTPIVDDPYDFGAIAAANALSDIYAMGAAPLSALNLVGFPDHALPAEVLVEILRGGAEMAKRAGIVIPGGHTIKSDEPIYGLAVTGTVHPDRIVRNDGARPGDVLVLTKPLGLGILTTAAKQNVDERGAIGTAIELMKTLNADACRCMLEVDAHAATDITGFGLLGHLRNLSRASGLVAHLDAGAIPFIDAAVHYVDQGIAPGGSHANKRFLDEWTTWGEDVDETTRMLCCDAQTSGGLLIAVDPAATDDLVAALRAAGTPASAVVGMLRGPQADQRPGEAFVTTC